MMILLYAYLASFGPHSSRRLDMLSYSHITETSNNNFEIIIRFTINRYVKTIIFYWIFHNLSMMYNTFLKGLFFDLLINFCITTVLRNS